MYEYELSNSIVEFRNISDLKTFAGLIREIISKLNKNVIFSISDSYVKCFLKTAELLNIPQDCFKMTTKINSFTSLNVRVNIIKPEKLKDFLDNV